MASLQACSRLAPLPVRTQSKTPARTAVTARDRLPTPIAGATGMSAKILAMKRRLDKDEQWIIDFCERVGGRKLTPQEVNLALEQARALGEI